MRIRFVTDGKDEGLAIIECNRLEAQLLSIAANILGHELEARTDEELHKYAQEEFGSDAQTLAANIENLYTVFPAHENEEWFKGFLVEGKV